MTALAKPLGAEMPRTTSLTMERIQSPRGTLVPLLLGGAVAVLGGVVVDQGTRVAERHDYRTVISGTSLDSVTVEGPVAPFSVPTRMSRIRALAPLSYREWAPVFGVSHSAVKQWADGDEPERDKLDRVLGALSEAANYQPDLSRWLQSALPGMSVRPLDLLRENRWRAFRGATRTRVAPVVGMASDEMLRRRQAQASWAVAEPTTVDDDA